MKEFADDNFKTVRVLAGILSMSHSVNSSSYPLTKQQILDSSKLKEFADNNFKFYYNGRKFFEPVKKTGKRRFAHYKQFLLFPVFSKDFCCRHIKPGLAWERVKGFASLNQPLKKNK